MASPAGATASSNFAALPIVGGVGVLGATGAGAYVYVGQAMQKARLEQAKRKLQEQYEKDPGAVGWLLVQKPFEAPSRPKWETDSYTPQVLRGAALFDNSAPAAYKIQGP